MYGMTAQQILNLSTNDNIALLYTVLGSAEKLVGDLDSVILLYHGMIKGS